MPGAPGYQAMGQPAGMPPGGPGGPTAKKKPNVGLLIGIGAGALVLIILVAVLFSRGGGVLGASPAEKANQTAQDYMTALSEGRAADALALIDSNYITDNTLLTDEVLADSLSRAPMTDVVVGEAVEEAGTSSYNVPVTYNLGDTPVSDQLHVMTWDDEPKLSSVLGSLSLTEDLEVTVNGVPASGSSLDVFPGSYEIDAVAEYLTYAGGPLLFTKSGEYLGSYELELNVTDEGITMFREKVIAEAEACLASKALDAGCGLSLPATLDDGTQLHDGGVTRTQDAEARTQLQNITPKPGYSVPTVIQVSGYDMGTVTVKAECTKDGSSGVCDIWGFGLGFGDASMNLADDDPVVQWD